MSFTEKYFIAPNIYSTGATADGYAFVTGTGTGKSDGYQLLGLMIENKTGSTLYAQLYDGYTASSIAGKTPILEIQIAQNAQQSLDLGAMHCIQLKKGILVAGSSTQWSFTTVSQGMFVTAFYI